MHLIWFNVNLLISNHFQYNYEHFTRIIYKLFSISKRKPSNKNVLAFAFKFNWVLDLNPYHRLAAVDRLDS